MKVSLETDDGLCAIDMSHRAGIDFDTVIPSTIKMVATTLVSICVAGIPNEGGVAWNVGQNGNLAIRVTPYRPNVRCSSRGTGPPPVLCRKILDQMPTDGEQHRFGPRDDPTADSPVPKRYTTPERRCALILDTTGVPDTGDWYKVWAAGIAIETMCVEAQEAAGLAVGLGASLGIVLSFHQ